MTTTMTTCACGHCDIHPHASDCSVHNEPAYPNGPCDCGTGEVRELKRRLLHIAQDNSPHDAQRMAERWAEDEYGENYWCR